MVPANYLLSYLPVKVCVSLCVGLYGGGGGGGGGGGEEGV